MGLIRLQKINGKLTCRIQGNYIELEEEYVIG
jgi:hypothetical protein